MNDSKRVSATPTMNDYYKVSFIVKPAGNDVCDLLADELAQYGYESFVTEDLGDASLLTAYVPAPLFRHDDAARAIDELIMPCQVTFDEEFVPGQDWNAEWEKNYFKPIVIGGKVAVHSSFHTDVPQAEYDIVVDPKMAFGTGHHATTTLMMNFILDHDMSAKIVVDMGTGTGILAILAAMRGAAHITAIEIDPFAADNAAQNIALNLHDSTDTVRLINGDATALAGDGAADVFLANINRNIITADIAAYSAAMKRGGLLAVSGFYVDDRDIVAAAAAAAGLSPVSADEMDRWSSMVFVKD